VPHPQQFNKDRVYPDAPDHVAAAFAGAFNENLDALLMGERIPQREGEQPRLKFFGGCCELQDVVHKCKTISEHEAIQQTLERVALREFMVETGHDTSKCFALFQRIPLTHYVGPKKKVKGYFLGLLRSSSVPCATRIEASEMRLPVWVPVANVLRGEHGGVKIIPQHQEAGIIAIATMLHLLEESIAADPNGEQPITATLKTKRDALSLEVAYALGSRGLTSLEEYAHRVSEEARQGIR
jgi:hypothetical protein